MKLDLSKTNGSSPPTNHEPRPDSIEVHNVREFKTSRGEVTARCDQCRYGVGHLADGFSVANPDRFPHVFNRHLEYTKRHQVMAGKKLRVVRHTDVSVGEVTAPTPFSFAVSKFCTDAERRLAVQAETTQTPDARAAATSKLADISRPKDGEFQIDGQHVQLCGSNTYILENRQVKGLNGGWKSTADRKYDSWQRWNVQAEGTEKTYEAYKYICETYSEVCQEWRWSYLAFFRDMGSKPQGCILTRWWNTGEFNKDNCFWATRTRWVTERMRGQQEAHKNIFPLASTTCKSF